MDPVDYPTVHAMTMVTTDALRKIGIKVDLQAMDWSTLLTRRAIKDAPPANAGGWHIFHSASPGSAYQNPLTNSTVAASCGKAWFGWPCDATLEARRLAYLEAATPAARKAAILALQVRFFETFPFVPLGQYLVPTAFRANITGLLHVPGLVMWNVEKL